MATHAAVERGQAARGDTRGPAPCARAGAFAQLGSLDSAWLPLALVLLKSLILPTLIKTVIALLGGSEGAQDFGFTFGVLPAAGSSLVFVQARPAHAAVPAPAPSSPRSGSPRTRGHRPRPPARGVRRRRTTPPTSCCCC